METRESLERGLEMVSARVDGRDPKGQLGAARNRQEAARARAWAPRHTPPGDFSWGRGEGFLRPGPSPRVDPECGPQSANGLGDGEARTTTRSGRLQGQGSERRDVTRTGGLAPLGVGLNGACDTAV